MFFLSFGQLTPAFSLKRKTWEKEAFAMQKLSLATGLSFPKKGGKKEKGRNSLKDDFLRNELMFRLLPYCFSANAVKKPLLTIFKI